MPYQKEGLETVKAATRPGKNHFGNNQCSPVIQQFKTAMVDAGIITDDEIITDGHLHRIHIKGHRHGSKNGAYILHLDRLPAGWFQDFKSGVSGTWKAGCGHWRMDDATRHEINAEKRRRQAEIDAKHTEKATKALAIWSKASPCASHPYLTRKRVKSHGLRLARYWPKSVQDSAGKWRQIAIDNALLVPLFDEHGKLWNVQAIFPEKYQALGRDKDFLGGRKAGLFFTIGEPTDALLIAEGYATAATVREATGYQTFVAFDCGNIKAVALAVRKLNSGKRITICADNDRHTPGNPGVIKAREAALAVGGFVSIPQFPEGADGTDFNDLAMLKGVSHGGA